MRAALDAEGSVEYTTKRGRGEDTETTKVRDMDTLQVGARDADGDGTLDTPWAHACVLQFPLVAVLYACHDTRTETTRVLAQAVVPMGVAWNGDDPCVVLGVAEVEAEGTAPPPGSAGLYGIVRCVDAELLP